MVHTDSRPEDGRQKIVEFKVTNQNPKRSLHGVPAVWADSIIIFSREAILMMELPKRHETSLTGSRLAP